MDVFSAIIIYQPSLVANIKKYCSLADILHIQQTNKIFNQQFSLTPYDLDYFCKFYLSKAKPYICWQTSYEQNQYKKFWVLYSKLVQLRTLYYYFNAGSRLTS